MSAHSPTLMCTQPHEVDDPLCRAGDYVPAVLWSLVVMAVVALIAGAIPVRQPAHVRLIVAVLAGVSSGLLTLAVMVDLVN
jgi:hypothetical protein